MGSCPTSNAGVYQRRGIEPCGIVQCTILNQILSNKPTEMRTPLKILYLRGKITELCSTRKLPRTARESVKNNNLLRDARRELLASIFQALQLPPVQINKEK